MSVLPTSRVFVIQFSADADPCQGRFNGRVEHVESGQSMRIASSEAMNEFFARILREEKESMEQALGGSATECHGASRHNGGGENK
jgi:hypothetical protein